VCAGALWEDVVPRASDLGLAALHGSSPNVGIAGYSLGGGLSFYARKYGLACNRVTAIELVTADGERIRVDADNEPDLFWALRGGGGSFGVVTALEFDLLPLPQVFAGYLFFPAEQASDVLHSWHEWIDGVPEEMTSVWRMLNFPPIPEIPEAFRGKSLAAIEAIYCGDPADGERLVAPLREVGDVEMDTMTVQPPAGIADLHMDPPEPLPYLGDSILIGDLPPAAMDSLLNAIGPSSGSQLISVELQHCGGALSRAPEGAGALATFPGSFLAFAVNFVPMPEMMAPTQAWLGAFKAALQPYDAGLYLNLAEERFEMNKAFPPETVDRLREMKRRYDPDDLFQSNHPVTA
jgi:FAD/FMN-containing dehydrogenase